MLVTHQIFSEQSDRIYLERIRVLPLCVNIDGASNEEADYEIFESPEGDHSEKGNAA